MPAATTPITRTATTCGPRMRPAFSRRWSRPGTALPRAGDVAVAGPHEDRAVPARVAHGKGAVGHRRAGARARVGRDPLRAADRRDAVAPVRPEPAAVIGAPELAPLRRDRRGARGARAAPA